MKQLHRKFIHILAVSPFVILGFFIDSSIPRNVFVVIAVVMLIAFLSFELYRLQNKTFKQKLMQKFSHLFKKEEENGIVSSIWGPVDLLILVLFFSKPTIVATLCVGCYSDPIAAMVGMKFGGKKNKNGKTWAGTTAFFVSSVILIVIAMAVIHAAIPWYFVILLSFIAAMLERYVTFGDDNLIVPLFFAICFEAAQRFF